MSETDTFGMPIGDPGGGNFEYTNEGLPQCIFLAAVPVSDIDKGLEFYRDLLGMEVMYRNDREAGLRRESARIVLRLSKNCGVDTGIYMGVDDPYDLHRRLIDEGVTFVQDPTREPWGVSTSFRDFDGNVIRVIEMKAPIRP
ncbi:MAG: VOC family protein [Candidatus Methanomethylophilaceae archaeon]|jgi:catechol 2,3-dioxygenase-like lactoylglutathione lyase family enzyme